MDFDIDLLEELLNDTTESEWKLNGSRIRIKTLSDKWDNCDVLNSGDAAFIVYVKNHAREIVDCVRDCVDEKAADAFCRRNNGVDDLDKLLDALDEADGFGDDE